MLQLNSNSKTKTLISYIILTLVFTLGLFTVIYSFKHHPAKPARAASTYIVDTNGDASDANPGDDICNTADDNCSLRAAIQEANAHAGADTIIFQDVGTIQPASAYDAISEQVEINGYTDTPGGGTATANTAVSPAPFNGTLAIEIDGQNAGVSHGLVFQGGSDNSVLRGVVINRFSLSGVFIQSSNVTVAGNYIGVGIDGTTDYGNGGVGVYVSNGSNSTIGGTAAADRNIISGQDNESSGVF